MHGVSEVAAVFLCLSFLPPSTPPDEAAAQANPTGLTAKAILERMTKVYAECDSYRDTGMIEETHSPRRPDRIIRKPFSTAYASPDRFRLEFEDLHFDENHIVHFDAQGLSVAAHGSAMTLKWSDLQSPHLSALRGAAVEQSAAVAYGVPCLLMPERTEPSYLSTLVTPVRIADSSVDEVECFCIAGATEAGTPVRIWVDKITYLLRRIDEEGLNYEDPFGRDLPARSSITIEPEINVHLSDEELRFGRRWEEVSVSPPAGDDTNGRQIDSAPRSLPGDTQNEEWERWRSDPRWDKIKRAVAHVNVIKTPAFHRSDGYWRSGSVPSGGRSHRSVGDLVEPIQGGDKTTVVVQGDCDADIRVGDSSMVHILGDLRGRVTVLDHCEVIVGGDVDEGAAIDCNGIVRVFVGGSVRGAVLSRGSLFVWVCGDFAGELTTGRPVTDLRVSGSFDGTIRPNETSAGLLLEVRGFCAEQRMKEIADLGYTYFAASLGKSDRPPGLYPDDYPRRNARWVIHCQQRGPSEKGGAAPDN